MDTTIESALLKCLRESDYAVVVALALGIQVREQLRPTQNSPSITRRGLTRQQSGDGRHIDTARQCGVEPTERVSELVPIFQERRPGPRIASERQDRRLEDVRVRKRFKGSVRGCLIETRRSPDSRNRARTMPQVSARSRSQFADEYSCPRTVVRQQLPHLAAQRKHPSQGWILPDRIRERLCAGTNCVHSYRNSCAESTAALQLRSRCAVVGSMTGPDRAAPQSRPNRGARATSTGVWSTSETV